MATWKEVISDPRWEGLDTGKKEILMNNWVADQERTNVRWNMLSKEERTNALGKIRGMAGFGEPQAESQAAEAQDTSLLDYPKAAAKGVVGVVGSTLKGAGELYGVAERGVERAAGAVLPEGAMGALTTGPWWLDPEQILKRPGKTIKDASEIFKPATPRLGTDIVEGVGQLGGQIGMWIASGGTLGLTTLLAQGADQMAERVEASDIPQANKDTAIALGSAITGLTEKIGLDLLLKRMPPAIKNKITGKAVDIAAAWGIEASQEFLEGLLHNATQKILDDPKVKLTGGLAYEAFTAGSAAGIVRAILTATTGKRVKASPSEDASFAEESTSFRDEVLEGEVTHPTDTDFSETLDVEAEQSALIAPQLEAGTGGLPEGDIASEPTPQPKALPPSTNPNSMMVKKVEADAPVDPTPPSLDMKVATTEVVEGPKIAEDLGIIYNGFQELGGKHDGYHLFTEQKFGATFAVPTLDPKVVKEKLDAKVAEFEAAQTKAQPERRKDLSTREKIDQIHLKAKEQGLEAVTDEDIALINQHTVGKAIERTVKNAADLNAALLERKARLKEKAATPKEDTATKIIRKRVLKNYGRDWMESFDEYRAEALEDKMSSKDANAYAMQRVQDESEGLVLEENERVKQEEAYRKARMSGKLDKSTPATPDSPTKSGVLPPQLADSQTEGGITGTNAKGLAKPREHEGEKPTFKYNKDGFFHEGVVNGEVRKIFRDTDGTWLLHTDDPHWDNRAKSQGGNNFLGFTKAEAIETLLKDTTPADTPIDPAQVKALLNKWYEVGGFEKLAPEEQALLTKAGKAPKKLGVKDVYNEATQSVGGKPKSKGVTLDFMGFQGTYEVIADKIMDAVERFRLDWGVNKNDMRNYLINEWLQTPRDIARHLPKFSPIVEAQELRDIARNEMEHAIANGSKTFWTLEDVEQKKVGDVLFKGDAEKAMYDEDTLRKRFSLNDTQIEAYNQVRGELDKIRDAHAERMKESGVDRILRMPESEHVKELNKLDAEIAKFLSGNKGYMPHRRYGTKALVVEGLVDGKWKTLHLEAFETSLKSTASMKRKKRYEQLKTAMKKFGEYKVRYVDLKGFAPEYADDLPSSAHFESILGEVQAMQEKMHAEGKPVEDIAAATREVLTKRRMVGGFSRHWVERENVAGFSGDAARVLADYFNGYAGYVTKFDAAQKMYEGISQIHPAREKRLYGYASRYIDYTLRHRGPEWHQMKAFMFYWYLGFNVKSAMMNGTQNFLTAAPALGVYSRRSGYRQIVKAMGDVAAGRVTAEESDFLAVMKSEGITKDLLTSELMGRPSNVFQKHLAPRALEMARFMFSSVEVFNRETTALAFYRAGKKKGLDAEQLKADVAAAIRNTHFSYGKADRPQLGRGRKGVLLTFRLFSINYVQYTKNLIKSGEYAAAGKSVGVLLALSGLSGFFGFELFNWMYGKATGGDLEERLMFYTKKAAESLLGKSHPKVVKALTRTVSSGVPAAFGLDFSGSLGAGDMIPTGGLWDIAGAPAGLGRKFILATRDFAAGDYSRAFEGMSPEALRNLQAAYRMTEKGMFTHSGSPIVDADGKLRRLSTGEASAKSIGIQPIGLSEMYLKNTIMRKRSDFRMNLKGKYLDAILFQWNERNFEKANEIWKESQEYDVKQDFPDKLMITPEDVAGRAYERTGLKEMYMKQQLKKLFGD